MRTFVQAVVITALVIGSLYGVILILGRNTGDDEFRVIVALFSVVLFGAFTLVALRLRASGRGRLLGTLTMVAALLAVVGLWWWALTDEPTDDGAQVLLTLIVLGLALGHASTLFCADLFGRFEWVRWGTVIAIAILAGMLAVEIWDSWDRDGERMMAVAGLLAGAGTFLVAILHGVTRRARGIVEGGAAPGVRHCPNCGFRLPADVTDVF